MFHLLTNADEVEKAFRVFNAKWGKFRNGCCVQRESTTQARNKFKSFVKWIPDGEGRKGSIMLRASLLRTKRDNEFTMRKG